MQPCLPYAVEMSVPATALPMMTDFVNRLLHLKASVLPLRALLLLPLGEKVCANSPEAKKKVFSFFLP